MDTNEKNPAREGDKHSAGERPSNGGRSGSRSGNGGRGGHHRGGRGRGGRGRGNGRPEARAEAPAAVTPPSPATEEPRVDAPAPAETAPSPDRSVAERRAHPSTGRPQRTIHRAANAEIPDMDDLLIEDGMVAADPRTLPPEGDAPDAAEIERILERDIFARPDHSIPEEIPEGQVVIVGVRFRAGGKTYFFDPGDITCPVGQPAIVETARGLEFGEICMGNRLLDESMVVPPLRPVIRLATEEDVARNRENHAEEDEAFRIGVEKIREHKLDMKLVTVQYTFDRAKLLFYFTSTKRVDFRELVKDLAGIFHLRIELRQIGIRDEARMIGGLGPCGRSLCCNTFLSDFGQVSMKMAKEQNLSLNSSKISGCCGRLMCCLRYEHETYLEEMRMTPSVGTYVNTPDGPGVVTEIQLLKGEVKVSLRNQPDSAPRKYKREVVEPQSRERRPAEPPVEAEAEAPSPETDEGDLAD